MAALETEDVVSGDGHDRVAEELRASGSNYDDQAKINESANEDEEETEESVIPNILPSPEAPSRKELAWHNIDHATFRSWCKHCVAGKAKAHPHASRSRSDEDEKTVPTLGLDYAFMSNQGSQETDQWSECKILVMKDDKSKYLFAVPIPQKGVENTEWAVRRVIHAIKFLGYHKIIVKGDQEGGLKTVIDAARAFMGTQIESEPGESVGLENSPVKDSQSNGSAERAVQTIEGQIRTLECTARKAWSQDRPRRVHPYMASAARR